jgi:hypothetical protein
VHLPDGTTVDITEGVQALYDLVISSMDWGSGFWTAEDAEPVVHVARTCGFNGCEEAERYVQARLDHDRRVNEMAEETRRNRERIEENRAVMAKRAGFELAKYDFLFTGDVTNDHAHAFEPDGIRCLWPGCTMERRLKVVQE